MDQISACDQFPRVSATYPWFVAQNLQEQQQNKLDLFFCTINNELPHYQRQIPGECIRGCFHGWFILSNHQNNNKWSLWNTVTSKIITLPTLILKDGKYKSIGECCLSAPPDDPTSILLLTRTDKSSFVFYRINSSKRNKFRWTEMSYPYEIKRLTYDGKLLRCLTCCNGKVYALCTDGSFALFVMHIDIMVKEKEVVINIMVFSSSPPSHVSSRGGDMIKGYLRGSAIELFYFQIYFVDEEKIPIDVYVHKSNMTCINWEEREYLKYWDMSHITNLDDVTEDEYEEVYRSEETWEKIDDLKDAIFYVDLVSDHSVTYGRVIFSELGGFIHIRGEMRETIYSYHVKNDTITVFPIPSPTLRTSHLSMWECMSKWGKCRLKDVRGEAKCIVDSNVEMGNKNEILLRSGTNDEVKFSESHLLNAPFNILETIIEFCVGVEYMKFRATCKQCHLAAPLVKWCNDTSIRRLQAYSVESPWLMVVDKKRGVLTFTDPMLGDNYFMKKSHITIVNRNFYGSRFGWVLFLSLESKSLVFFNPFTNDILELPDTEYYFISMCFSAPPTSLDCLVVGFTDPEDWCVNILLVNQEKTWRTVHLGPDPHTVCFSTIYDRDVYALCRGGELIVMNNMGKENYSWKLVETKARKGLSTQYFLTTCNQRLLLVSVGGEYGGPVEVFKFNESRQEWGKIDSVGKHMLYICGTTCLCIEAKVPKMENKIFFPRLYNRKVVFYSLVTCKYHIFDSENLQELVGGLFGTTYPLSHNAWIEPSWS